ncbi:MAG: DNA-directed RNA polymerase subunit K [Ignisphaera sp.]
MSPRQQKYPILVKSIDDVVIGPKRITKYERARIIAARAIQLAMGAPPLIDISKVEFKDVVTIAEKELEMGILPMLIKRELPNGEYQLIPVKVFIDVEKKRNEYIKNLIKNIFGEESE